MSNVKPETVDRLIREGKPFIVGTYLGCDIAEQMFGSKANPAVKENRVILQHTVKNKNGIHVFAEWLEAGSYVVKDAKTQEVTHAVDTKKEVRKQTIATGATVLVTLTQFERDGVGKRISGAVEVLV